MEEIPCEFCIEIEKPEESYFYTLFASRGIKSRILYEDSKFIVIPGLGSLTDGYILILPKQHNISLSYLSIDSLSELEKLKDKILRFMRKEYSNIFCFEHGAASNTCRAGSCVDHAHLHVCPCPTSIENNIDQLFEKRHLNSMLDLAKFSEENIPYIYYENQDGDKWAYLLPSRIQSQYMRRLWADAIEKPDEWDWALFVGHENILKTMRLFGKE